MKEMVLLRYKFMQIRKDADEYLSENCAVLLEFDQQRDGYWVSYRGFEVFSACPTNALMNLSVESGVSLFDMLHV